MAVDQTQSFQLRISILYCLQCYLYKNDLGKSMIIQMLLPEIHHGQYFLLKREKKKRELFGFDLDTDQHSLGHLLIICYMSKDVVASWCCGIALSHLIADSLEYKETILQVVLQINQDQTAAKSLMEISFDLLQNVNKRKYFLFPKLNIVFLLLSIAFIFISYSYCCTDLFMYMVIELFISSTSISFRQQQYILCM